MTLENSMSHDSHMTIRRDHMTLPALDLMRGYKVWQSRGEEGIKIADLCSGPPQSGVGVVSKFPQHRGL